MKNKLICFILFIFSVYILILNTSFAIPMPSLSDPRGLSTYVPMSPTLYVNVTSGNDAGSYKGGKVIGTSTMSLENLQRDLKNKSESVKDFKQLERIIREGRKAIKEKKILTCY